jgi:hypothetical protein
MHSLQRLWVGSEVCQIGRYKLFDLFNSAINARVNCPPAVRQRAGPHVDEKLKDKA